MSPSGLARKGGRSAPPSGCRSGSPPRTLCRSSSGFEEGAEQLLLVPCAFGDPAAPARRSTSGFRSPESPGRVDPGSATLWLGPPFIRFLGLRVEESGVRAAPGWFFSNLSLVKSLGPKTVSQKPWWPQEKVLLARSDCSLSPKEGPPLQPQRGLSLPSPCQCLV